MSKASQRKVSSYNQGVVDGSKGYGRRYSKYHPRYLEYSNGYKKGIRIYRKQMTAVHVVGTESL